MVIGILLMLMPLRVLAGMIPVAILHTNTDGTRTLTFTYVERPKVFAKRGQDGIHRLNRGKFKDKPEKYNGIEVIEDRPTWISFNKDYEPDLNTAKITKVVFDKSFAQATPISTFYWFGGMKNLKSIIGLNHLNTSYVKYMDRMFCNCSSLDSLDISNFDTESVESMVAMFEGCTNLKEVDVSQFDTNNVNDFSSMFRGCSNLTSLDLSSFNVKKCMFFISMFEGCSNLKAIDVSNFNTASAANMNSMFKGCSNIQSLDISQFAFGTVRWMNNFLADCSKLTSLIVGNNDLKDLVLTDFAGNTITEKDRIGDAFRNVGTNDNPCQLIIGPSFDKTVVGVKHSNDDYNFYRWYGGYFSLLSGDTLAKKTNEVRKTNKARKVIQEQKPLANINNNDNTIYAENNLDEKAAFPGGWKAYGKYIDENVIHSPNGKSGNICINVVIEKDGSITNAKVVYSRDNSINSVALELIKQMPKWTPAKKDGIPVRSQTNLYYNIK